MEFKKVDLLKYSSLENYIISEKANEKASIITDKLKKYFIIFNGSYYKYDSEHILYIKQDIDEDDLYTIISLFIEKSYDNLKQEKKDLINTKYKKYSKIFKNSTIKSIIPQIKSGLKNDNCNLGQIHSNEIHFLNGYYDFKDNTFKKRIEGVHYIDNVINRNYEKPEQEIINEVYKTIDRIYPNKDDRDYLLMTYAIAFSGLSVKFQQCLFLLGKGSTGKSTIIELLKMAFTDAYTIALKRDSFSRNNSKIDKILNTFRINQNIRICHINEPEDTKIDDCLFKDFIDGNLKTTILYKDGNSDFNHYSKLVVTSNTMPNIKIDDGTERRIESYTHTSIFTKNKNEIDDKKNIYYADENLLGNFQNNEKLLNGLCSIIFEYGYNYLSKKKIFKQTENFKNTKNDIITINDPIQDFIDVRLIKVNNEQCKITRDDMYNMFKSQYKTSYITSQQLFNSLKLKGILYNSNRKYRGMRGYFYNIKFNFPKDDDIESEDEKAFNKNVFANIEQSKEPQEEEPQEESTYINPLIEENIKLREQLQQQQDQIQNKQLIEENIKLREQINKLLNNNDDDNNKVNIIELQKENKRQKEEIIRLKKNIKHLDGFKNQEELIKEYNIIKFKYNNLLKHNILALEKKDELTINFD